LFAAGSWVSDVFGVSDDNEEEEEEEEEEKEERGSVSFSYIGAGSLILGIGETFILLEEEEVGIVQLSGSQDASSLWRGICSIFLSLFFLLCLLCCIRYSIFFLL
jgi:hypothetical protein